MKISEYKQLIAKRKKHKYNAQPTVVSGIRFDSKKEANHFSLLKKAQKSGALKMFLRQVPFDLPGGAKYKLDFLEFWHEEIIFTEIKGLDLPIGRLKRKQVEEIYGIKITII